MSQPVLNSHRHCMVVHNYYPVGEPRVQRQADALAEAGAEVDVICLRRPGEPAVERQGAIQIFRMPVRRNKKRGMIGQLGEYLAFFVLALLRLSARHLRRRYHIVQIHNLPDFLVFSALIPRLSGAAVILDIHDLMPEFYASRFNSGLGTLPVKLVRVQEQISCRFAHHIITVTEVWRKTLLQRGVPAHKCSVVMNVADTDVFKPSRSPQSADHGFHLIYHGTLTHRYGIDLALRAVAQAQCHIPNLRLTIHGRGEYLPRLEQLVKALELQNSVRFSTRLMPIKELPELLLSADVGLVPYRRDVFTDGILPTKLMEYAALGLPAIAARTPSIMAYFDDGMVQFFDPEDVEGLAQCIQVLYENRSQRSELSRNIKRFNEQHNWTRQRADYISLVKGLADRKVVKLSYATKESTREN